MAVLLLKQNWNCCWVHSRDIYSSLWTGQNRVNTCHILNAFRLLKGKGHWSQQLMLVLLSNLLVTWIWGLDWTNRSTVGQEAGRAWAWPEVSGLALAGASLEIMLPSCNTVWQWLTLCSHLNWAILGCYTLKQWDWESGDEWFPCPGPQEARERSSDLPLPADSPIGSSSTEHHVTFYWSTPCGWLGQFFFFLSKSRFLSVSSDRRKAWNSVNVSGNLESLFL